MRSLDSGSTFLLLGNTLGNESIVFLFLLFLTDKSPTVEGSEVATALKTDGSDETLDLGAKKN